MKWVGYVADGQGHCSQDGASPHYVAGSLNLHPLPGQEPLRLHVTGNDTDDDGWMPVKRYGSIEFNGLRFLVLVGLGNRDVTEIRCATRLRDLGLRNGDLVTVTIPD